MENGLIIYVYNPVVKCFVSFVTINVAEVGAKGLVSSWNAHPLEGIGKRLIYDCLSSTEQVN